MKSSNGCLMWILDLTMRLQEKNTKIRPGAGSLNAESIRSGKRKAHSFGLKVVLDVVKQFFGK